MAVGKRVNRVDAPDKVRGAARYAADLLPRNALCTRIVRSTVANGRVLSIDKAAAEAVPGVAGVFTCFDAPKNPFPTAGHPWSLDPEHQDVCDRFVLTDRPLYYGDDIAVVVAEDEVSAARAARLVKVEYEAYPFVLDQMEAMAEGAPLLHPEYPNNILKHSAGSRGDYAAATEEPGLLCLDKWYDTPVVQHCHIENPFCFAYMESGKVVVVSSTQIPHIIRRVVGQALGRPWGDVRIIKPYIGGGFGNKQDALYEPLCAWLATQLNRPVKIDTVREETFANTRVRHAMRFRLVTHFRPDGTFVARKMEVYSKQGAYASHGHSVVSKSCSAFAQLYRCEASEYDAYTVFTNTATAGAMRAYGIPQVTFAMESHCDDIARLLGMDPVALRRLNLMEVGYKDDFTGNVNWDPSFEQCMQKGMEYIGWGDKLEKYQNQTGPVRRGVGMAVFWYNTGVWPISLEISSCRMALNQDGSVQFMTGETEIGQGADTVFAQMAADAVGVPFESVHVTSSQDTDIHPFGTGAYGSRQTYAVANAICKTAELFRAKIFEAAGYFLKRGPDGLDLKDGQILDRATGGALMPLSGLGTAALYDMGRGEHILAESSCQTKTNAYSFGCAFAEVEVDIPLCRVKLLDLVDVHDCGRLINPALAEAQVHGGMSMAIGYGLGEQLLYDGKTGKPLNNNLLDYKLSTALDHPDLGALFVENPEPTSPFGTKALGEPPAVPGAPAIRNAVLNAVGVAVDKLPLSPHALFERFREEGILNV